MQQSSYRPLSHRRKERKAKKNIIWTVILIIFLLYALISWILPNLIGGLSLVNKLKQPTPTVEPIVSEAGTLAPPVLNIPYEATNTATIKIKGYASAETKVDIYVDDEIKSSTTTDQNGSFLAENIDLSLGTNTIYGKTSNDKASSLSSKPIKVIFTNEKPKLNLTSPSDGQLVKGGDKKVTVSGSTNPADEITANGTKLIVNSDGNFSQAIAINEGDNQITVISRDSAGNQNLISVKVTYQP